MVGFQVNLLHEPQYNIDQQSQSSNQYHLINMLYLSTPDSFSVHQCQMGHVLAETHLGAILKVSTS
jgi:hypothetical protein